MDGTLAKFDNPTEMEWTHVTDKTLKSWF